jgi:DNA-binding MarR family transcriptional regulator
VSTPAPLTPAEERLWRDWVRLNAELTMARQRDLQADGLSAPDFDVLVRLAQDADGRARITDLAGDLQWERSRVSHHVARMAGRDLVRRVECPSDGRGAFVVLTPAGRAALERATPGHVRTVRRLLLDVLGPDGQARLAGTLEALLAVHDRR